MDNVMDFPGGIPSDSDVATENSVLGALLNAEDHPLDCREEIFEIFEKSKEKAFVNLLNRRIYQAFIQCVIDGNPSGAHGVVSALRESGELTEELMERIYHLSASAGGPVEATHGAKVLNNLYRRRTVAAAMEDGARLVRSGEHDTNVAISDAFSSVASAVEIGEAPDSRYERGRLVDEGLGVILGLHEYKAGISYGLPDLDKRTSGMHDGQMTAIAARSGYGKTIIATNIARHASIKQGIPTVFFSLEMKPGTLIQRIASAELGIPYNRIRENQLETEERERIARFADRECENENFRIEYVPGAKASELYLLARKSIRDMGAQLFIVDYAQSVEADDRVDNEGAKMDQTVPRLAEIATKFDTHLLLLAQLKKPTQGREGDAPNVQDMRYGTKIENIASTIMLVHRLHLEGKPGSDVEVHFEKNRNGTLGVEELIFDGERQRFLPADSRLNVKWDEQ